MKQNPTYNSSQFQCPHCQVVAQQQWFDADSASENINQIIHHLYLGYRSRIQDYQQTAIAEFINSTKNNLSKSVESIVPDKFSIATCGACRDVSLWVSREMVYPRKTSLPPPNQDLDDDIQELYLEAANIFTDSPKGATALLRLALQKTLKQVGKEGKNINNDIKALVAEGLSQKIQQALDLLRVVGNHAVHPGQIDLDDNSEVAFKLFTLLNFIAEELITKPKELEFLYDGIIPDDTKEHIKQRDGTE